MRRIGFSLCPQRLIGFFILLADGSDYFHHVYFTEVSETSCSLVLRRTWLFIRRQVRPVVLINSDVAFRYVLATDVRVTCETFVIFRKSDEKFLT